jgi:hypothetical protein
MQTSGDFSFNDVEFKGLVVHPKDDIQQPVVISI